MNPRIMHCLLARVAEHAGAGTRVSAEQFSIVVDDEEQIMTYFSHAPMSDYKLLLERQAIQVVTLYSD